MDSVPREITYDDEYFRTMVAIRADAASHPAAAAVLAKVHRSLARPEHQRFATALSSIAREVTMRTLAGLHVGSGTTYSVDLKRLDRVIARSMRGLHLHHSGVRVAPEGDVTVFCLEGFLVHRWRTTPSLSGWRNKRCQENERRSPVMHSPIGISRSVPGTADPFGGSWSIVPFRSSAGSGRLCVDVGLRRRRIRERRAYS